MYITPYKTQRPNVSEQPTLVWEGCPTIHFVWQRLLVYIVGLYSQLLCMAEIVLQIISISTIISSHTNCMVGHLPDQCTLLTSVETNKIKRFFFHLLLVYIFNTELKRPFNKLKHTQKAHNSSQGVNHVPEEDVEVVLVACGVIHTMPTDCRTALSDRGQTSPYVLQGAYYLEDRDSRSSILNCTALNVVGLHVIGS